MKGTTISNLTFLLVRLISSSLPIISGGGIGVQHGHVHLPLRGPLLIDARLRDRRCPGRRRRWEIRCSWRRRRLRRRRGRPARGRRHRFANYGRRRLRRLQLQRASEGEQEQLHAHLQQVGRVNDSVNNVRLRHDRHSRRHQADGNHHSTKRSRYCTHRYDFP